VLATTALPDEVSMDVNIMPMEVSADQSIKSHFQSLVEVIQDRSFALLIPLFALLAMTIIFSFGTLPVLSVSFMNTSDHTDESIIHIAYMFIAYGVMSTVSAYISGHIYDRGGDATMLIVVVIFLSCQYGSLLCLLQLYPTLLSKYVWIWYAYGGGAGLTDIALTTMINNVISHKWSADQVPYLFAWYRFFYCLILAGISLISMVISPVYSIIMILGTMLLSTVFYGFHSYRQHQQRMVRLL
jgi:MFS family permease